MTDTETYATEVLEGAKHLFNLAQTTSESDVPLAILQLLTAAIALARAAKMDRKDFMEDAGEVWEATEIRQ